MGMTNERKQWLADLRVGDEVAVVGMYCPLTGKVKRISPTRSRFTVLTNIGIEDAFNRDGRTRYAGMLFIRMERLTDERRQAAARYELLERMSAVRWDALDEKTLKRVAAALGWSVP